MKKSDNYVEIINEEETSFSDDSLFNISSYGIDIAFRELISMYDEAELIKPEMQRRYVWSKLEASRFIDSILLGLPVPSIFLAKTSDERKLIVDGYQRIMTIYDYVKKGVFGTDKRAFALSKTESINIRWRGKTYAELRPEEQRKIKNYPIHAIVFEQREPKDDTGMYQVFERINTSGRSLKSQEIRNCVYHGPYNQFLIELNEDVCWRKIWGDDVPDSRMLDIELVLRMFAFADARNREELQKKEISLVKFLNEFMRRGNELKPAELHIYADKFHRNIEFIYSSLGDKAFRNGKLKERGFVFAKSINPAIMDSVYAATNYVLDVTPQWPILSIKSYTRLLGDEEYQGLISYRTTNVDNIKRRIGKACEILYGVKYEWCL